MNSLSTGQDWLFLITCWSTSQTGAQLFEVRQSLMSGSAARQNWLSSGYQQILLNTGMGSTLWPSAMQVKRLSAATATSELLLAKMSSNSKSPAENMWLSAVCSSQAVSKATWAERQDILEGGLTEAFIVYLARGAPPIFISWSLVCLHLVTLLNILTSRESYQFRCSFCEQSSTRDSRAATQVGYTECSGTMKAQRVGTSYYQYSNYRLYCKKAEQTEVFTLWFLMRAQLYQQWKYSPVKSWRRGLFRSRSQMKHSTNSSSLQSEYLQSSTCRGEPALAEDKAKPMTAPRDCCQVAALQSLQNLSSLSRNFSDGVVLERAYSYRQRIDRREHSGGEPADQPCPPLATLRSSARCYLLMLELTVQTRLLMSDFI